MKLYYMILKCECGKSYRYELNNFYEKTCTCKKKIKVETVQLKKCTRIEITEDNFKKSFINLNL